MCGLDFLSQADTTTWNNLGTYLVLVYLSQRRAHTGQGISMSTDCLGIRGVPLAAQWRWRWGEVGMVSTMAL